MTHAGHGNAAHYRLWVKKCIATLCAEIELPPIRTAATTRATLVVGETGQVFESSR
jgi:hypothetical protein